MDSQAKFQTKDMAIKKGETLGCLVWVCRQAGSLSEPEAGLFASVGSWILPKANKASWSGGRTSISNSTIMELRGRVEGPQLGSVQRWDSKGRWGKVMGRT